tara:strand:+ start:2827 stop:3252 length:426 start_codon:yes stop_codon:yes gene_type:complete
MNMIIKSINVNSKQEINKFLKTAGSSLLKFRYFDTRDSDVLQNHLLTLLGFEGPAPIAYGHLDVDDKKLWLGICVVERYTKLGLGKKIMYKLVEAFNEQECYDSLYLAVDKDNHPAISMYNKFKFFTVEENKVHYIMRLDK